MKSNILFSGLAALTLVSGANAAQYRPVKMSYGPQFRPFIGATMGMQMVSWANEVEKDAEALSISLPEDFFSFGIEGGFRFGNYHEIYNGGFTVNLDMSTPDNVEATVHHFKVAEMSTMSISATYDNYIRLSGDKLKRIDLVLGAGVGALDEKTRWDHLGTTQLVHLGLTDTPANDNDWAGTIVLKAGFEFELTKNISLSAHTRAFFPVKSDYDFDNNFLFGGTVKYIF